MNEERIDFSPLDPTRDRARFDSTVRSISARAAGALAARRARSNPVSELARWRRPVLAAAAVALLFCGGVLIGVRTPAQVPESGSIAEAIGVPSLLAEGLQAGELPTPADLFVAFEGLQ
jgi:hypothetical protein